MASSAPPLGTRPWIMLGLGLAAQTAATMVLSTPAFLIPLLHAQQRIPLSQSGLLAATTTIGMVLTLVAWGAVADKAGERWVISGGGILVALATAAAALGSTNFAVLSIFFVFAGMASASANAASGRLVVGWFPRERRGLAMGIRQMCQPLGVALAALIIPPVAVADGIATAIAIPAIVSGVVGVACLLVLRDPARPPVTAASAAVANPYARSSTLLRIHLVSILLVVPQFTISTFGLVWLITQHHLSPLAAGTIVGVSQFVGAVGRVGAGILSDRVGSRMRPLRWVALAAVAAMVALAAFDALSSAAAIALLVVATTISVADNGLAFAAVAEVAGPRWSGRALGAQNTGQYIAASAVAPLAGLLIGIAGYPLTFLAAAACALIAVPLVPASGDPAHDDAAHDEVPRGTPPMPAELSGSRLGSAPRPSA